MGLGNTPKATYLSISKDEGKIRHKSGDNETLYDYLEGRLQKVDLKEEEYKGNTYFKYYFHFEDSGQLLILQSSEGSTFSRSLLNSLAGLEDPSTLIRIQPYQKESGERSFTVPYVTYGPSTDNTVSWAVPPENIPDTERVSVGQKEVFDDTARRKFFRKMAASINKKLDDRTGPEYGDSDNGIASKDQPGMADPSQEAETTSSGQTSPTDAYAETAEDLGEELPDDFSDLDDELPF